MSFLEGQPRGVVNATPWADRETTYMENFDAVWKDDNLRMAGNGLEVALQDEWAKNFQAYEAATGQRLHEKALFRHAFLNRARQAEGNDVDLNDLDADLAATLEEADAKIRGYQAAHPEDQSVRTFDEMWGTVKERNLQFRDAAASIGERASAAGTMGGFTAGLISSVNPRTNFFNFATLGLGGFGKGVISRIATEAGTGASIEAINQFTGIAERQRLLGTPTTTGEKLSQVALAGVAAGGLRGVAEGTPALAKAVERKVAPQRAAGREFLKAADEVQFRKDLRNDYADAAMAFDPGKAPTASGRAAAVAEQTNILFARANPFDDTAAGEDAHFAKFSDVSEPVLANLRERLLGSTAAPRATGVEFKASDYDATVSVQKTLDEANRDPNVIELARSYDHQAINEYERLNKEIVTKRRWYDELGGEARAERTARRLADAEVEIQRLEATQAGKSAKGSKAIQKEIDALRKEMDVERTRLNEGETPDMKRIREEITAADLKLRDMSEEVSGLFKRAREKLDVQAPVTKTKIAPSLRNVVEGLVERGEIDPQFPLRSALDAANPRKINGRRVEEVTDNLVRDLEELDPKAEALHEAEAKSVNDTINEDTNTVTLGRGIGEVDLDNTRIQLNDSIDNPETMSLREYLVDEAKYDDEFLSSLTSCATGGTV